MSDSCQASSPNPKPISLREFLAVSDEKSVLAEVLLEFLVDGTILDVGAGTGEIPTLMKVDPQSYTAVECLDESVEELRRRGFSVIHDLFPCDVGGLFDNVLLSYCLYAAEQTRVMIEGAWRATAPGGRLVGVTFSDAMDPYNVLLHRIGHTARRGDGSHFRMVKGLFSKYGKLEHTTLISHLYCETFEDLADTISFMATNANSGTLEWRAVLRDRLEHQREYLDERYLTRRGTYEFPIEHHLLVVDKGSGRD